MNIKELDPDVFLKAAEFKLRTPINGCCWALRQTIQKHHEYTSYFYDMFRPESREHAYFFAIDVNNEYQSEKYAMGSRVLGLLLCYEVLKSEQKEMK